MTPTQLKRLRSKANLTQAALAKLCHCSRSYINQMERGSTRITPTMEGKLTKALGGIPVITPTSDEMKELSRIWREHYAPIDWFYG